MGPMSARLSCLLSQDRSHHLYYLSLLFAFGRGFNDSIFPISKVEGLLDRVCMETS